LWQAKAETLALSGSTGRRISHTSDWQRGGDQRGLGVTRGDPTAQCSLFPVLRGKHGHRRGNDLLAADTH